MIWRSASLCSVCREVVGSLSDRRVIEWSRASPALGLDFGETLEEFDYDQSLNVTAAKRT